MRMIFARTSFTAAFALLMAVAAASADRPDWVTIQQSGHDASFRGIAVRSDREAFVSGTNATLLHSVDAGQSWNRITVANAESDFDFRDIALPDAQSVVVMSAGPGDKSRVYRSSDNGKSWTTALENEDPKGFFNAITFSNSRHGFLIGDPIKSKLDVYTTTDGGQSWHPFPGPNMNDGEYGFAASGTNIVSLNDGRLWIATGGSIARVLRSASGKWFQAVKSPIAQGNESSGIFSIAFRDQQHGVIVGGDYKNPTTENGNIAYSHDGGISWKLSAAKGIGHKACVRHVGDQNWMTVGRTGIAISTDDGRSWRHVSDDGYYTFDVDAKTGVGWMAGADGRIARFVFPK